ncbi:MAG: hypothetical protein QM811_32075 [Pirellulales bacterium]
MGISNFAPLFARRGAARLIEALFKGEPVAWSILVVVVVVMIASAIYKSKQGQARIRPPDNPYRFDPQAATTAGLRDCPRCGVRVQPMLDGFCPACKEHRFVTT